MNYKRFFIPNSLIFVTIVTNNRRKILIENIETLHKCFELAKSKFKCEIVAFVINPDHLHMIIKTENIKDYPKIIGYIKKSFTQLSNIDYVTNNNREANIWQRRYWEHTTRDENDLYRHLDYIHYNSVKHSLVNSPKDWKYSSFQQFVKNGFYELDWCNFDDKYNIYQMNCE